LAVALLSLPQKKSDDDIYKRVWVVSSNAKGLAGRYAGALYDLCVDAKATENVLSDLKAVKALISENKSLSQLVNSPVYSREQQSSAMLAIVEKAGAHKLTANFIGAVAQNGRLFALSQIIDAFIAEVAHRNGEISAEVISAVALDKSREALVRKTVSDIAGSEKISLEMKVDPALIGGLVVRIGSRLIDTSIKTKLSRLEAAMKGVA